MKILIAEDDLVSRKVLAKTLKQWGYEVISAVDGREAWDLLQSETPQMAILDWMMPHMDGLEVIKKIRQTKYDYLTKPFDRGELLARLRAGQRIIELEKSLAQKNAQLSEVNQSLGQANNRMKRDLDAAAEIQKSLLPNQVPQIDNVNTEWF